MSVPVPTAEALWVEAHLTCEGLHGLPCPSTGWLIAYTPPLVDTQEGWRRITCRLCAMSSRVRIPFPDFPHNVEPMVAPHFKTAVANAYNAADFTRRLQTKVMLRYESVTFTATAAQKIDEAVWAADVSQQMLTKLAKDIEANLKEDCFDQLLRYTFNVKVLDVASGVSEPTRPMRHEVYGDATMGARSVSWRGDMRMLREQLALPDKPITVWPFEDE